MLVVKTLHIACAVLWLGNFVVTGVWSVRAFATREPALRAFAVREIIFTDIVFTLLLGSAVITSGIGLAFMEGFNPWAVFWTRLALVLAIASGVVWLALLVPLELKMRSATGALVRQFVWWNAGGWLVTVVLFFIIYLMVAKPA